MRRERPYSDLMAILAEWIMPYLSVSFCLSANISADDSLNCCVSLCAHHARTNEVFLVSQEVAHTARPSSPTLQSAERRLARGS
jgi:hypothetical protein